MGLITHAELSHALAARLEWAKNDADERAEAVLEVFGFHDEVIDNLLEPEDRQLFYALQTTGLVTTRSEEILLPNGQTWRTHYWIMREDRVRAAAAVGEARERLWSGAPVAPDEDVYGGLPATSWTRKNA